MGTDMITSSGHTSHVTRHSDGVHTDQPTHQPPPRAHTHAQGVQTPIVERSLLTRKARPNPTFGVLVLTEAVDSRVTPTFGAVLTDGDCRVSLFRLLERY